MLTSLNRQGDFMASPDPKHARVQNQTFPALYHAHHQSYTEDLHFWQKLAREQGGTILELGCGTGRVLIPLAEAGHTVFGVDLSPQMLALLKKNIPLDSEPRAHTILGDFTDFKIERRFALILLPCNTFSTLNKDERTATLAGIQRHLISGGTFVTSIPNPTVLAKLPHLDQVEIETIFLHPETGNPVQVGCDWEPTETQVTMNWHYDHLLPNGQVDRLTVSTRHFLTSVAEYQDEIQTAGLTISATYGDFNHTPYQPESPYLIFVTQKIL